MVAEDMVALRVAMLAPGELFGGAERQVLLLLRVLRDRQIPCALFVFHDRELARQARALGISTRVLHGSSGFDLRMAKDLARQMREEGFVVLHIHGYKPAAMALAARASCEFAALKTEHGGSELQGASLQVKLKLHLYRLIERLAVRRLGASVVYVTGDLRERYRPAHRGLSTYLISNGIDPTDLDGLDRPAEFKADRFNLVVAGRLEPVKGIDLAIRALQSDRMPPDAFLHIVGEGPLRETLQKLATACGVGERVQFHGFRTDSTRFIAHADAVLMPSLHEGLPYTLLESLAAGVPVVASAVGGLKEKLRDRETALLVPPGDATALAQAVQKLYTDPSLRETLSTQGRRELLASFSAQAMGEAYLKIYRELAVRLSRTLSPKRVDS